MTSATEAPHGYFEALYIDYRDALDKACEIIAEAYGTCPRDHYELDADETCERECSTKCLDVCWEEYLLKERFA